MIEILLMMFIILYLYFIFIFKKENFNTLNNLKQNTGISNEDLIKSVDNTLKQTKNKLGTTDLNLNDKVFLEYLDKQIISDTLETNNYVNSNLPQIIDNDYLNYNHQLKLLINSKKLKQDYILEILKKKVKYLNETLKNVEDINEK